MSLELIAVGPDELPRTNVLLQTGVWARLKSEFGWSAHRFRLRYPDREGEGDTPLVLLTRTIRGLITVGYLPYPCAPDAGVDSILQLPSLLAEQLDCPVAVLRLDLIQQEPLVEAGSRGPTPAETLINRGFRKAATDVQPASSVVVDLTADDEAMLAAMKSKTRYNIRLAEKRGVVVRPAGADQLPRWYDLYRETAARDRIVLHSFAYYERLFALAADDRLVRVQLLFAEHEGDLLAGVVVAMVGDCATYLYGASSTEKRNLMASHAVQWSAMRVARDAGCSRYDMFGIPPDDDSDHPMAGLYRFKTGFGGRIVHRLGCYDFPLQPLRYRLFRASERLRHFYFKRIRKRLTFQTLSRALRSDR